VTPKVADEVDGMLRPWHVRGDRIDRPLRRAGRDPTGQRQQHRGREPPNEVSVEPATAWWLSLRSFISARTLTRRSTGSRPTRHGEVGESRGHLVVGAALGLCAYRHGHHRADHAVLESLAAAQQQVAEAAHDHGEYDVVDGAA
jgi:hypothetical protein